MNLPTNFRALPTLFVQAALITTATVLAIVLVTKYVAPIPLSITQTTTQKSSAFSATGKSSLTTIPDKVEVVLGISRKEATIQQAQSKSNEIINTINQKLQELGVKKDDIKTQSYTINPNYDYQRATQDIVGYSVDVSLKVSLTDFEKLNKVVDLATAAGANQVGGVQFTLTDEKERTVKAEARKKAIEDAEKNAQELANLAGMKLGRVINVTETGNNPTPGPIMYDSMQNMAGKGGGAPTNIEPGSTSYDYYVTISYETL